MSGPVRGLLLIAPRANHHVQLLAEQLAHQRWRGSRVIRRVAINQHIDVGVHIGETAAHHIALALQRQAPARRPLWRSPRWHRWSCCPAHGWPPAAMPRQNHRPLRQWWRPRCGRAPAQRCGSRRRCRDNRYSSRRPVSGQGAGTVNGCSHQSSTLPSWPCRRKPSQCVPGVSARASNVAVKPTRGCCGSVEIFQYGRTSRVAP